MAAAHGQMKAAQFHPHNLAIKVNVIPIPEPKDDEILIRTIAAGLCHSDMMLIDGSTPVVPTKIVTIGHEAVGEVVSFGSQVTGFEKGDLIGFINAHHACWKCSGCAVHYLFCEAGTMQMQGYSLNGFMQEYCVIDYKAATLLPAGMDVAKAAPLCCAGITAYHAVQNAQLDRGGWLAVIGCGGLGQMAIRYAKAMGYRVIAIDIDNKVLEVAQQAGVDYVFNSKSTSEYVKTIHGITQGGVDAVLVFTAVKAGYDSAPKVLKIGGKIVCVGVPPVDITFSALDISLGKFSILGASNHATPAMLRECAEFTFTKGIECPQQFFKIDQISKMIELMETGKMNGTRLVVEF